jgi:hypothetical protein
VPLRFRGLLKGGKQTSLLTNQIPAELIQGHRTVCSVTHKLIRCIYSNEELPQQRKRSITVPIYKEGDERVCSNYCGTSITKCMQILIPHSSSRLASSADKITGDHKCEL